MRKAVALVLGAMFAAVLPSRALADPVRVLPNGGIEFDVRVTTSGSLFCQNTEYAPNWHCQELAGGSVELRNAGEVATIGFIGQDQTFAVANTPRSITLGDIVGEATPGFVFPVLPSPQWAMLSLNLLVAHGGGDIHGDGGFSWSFAPGGTATLPLLFGDFSVGVGLGTRPGGYEYGALVYEFPRIPSIPSDGTTAIVADVGAVPEPGTLLLLGSGLLAFRFRGRRRK